MQDAMGDWSDDDSHAEPEDNEYHEEDGSYSGYRYGDALDQEEEEEEEETGEEREEEEDPW